ncbi:MAG: OmpH family outer membrane protein [Candidatus Melainabacteria bacterium]|nr:OmpH family outer membrane protein [Candidatus Melainabacteria bacterium]
MKKFILLILVLTLNPCFAEGIASLDILEIYKNYSLVLEANAEVDEAEASFRRVLETANKELMVLQAQEGKEKEFQAKQQEIQTVVDEQVEQLQDKKDEYNTQINRNIAQTLNEIVKSKKLDLIIEKGYLLADVDDITNEFLAALEKKRKK